MTSTVYRPVGTYSIPEQDFTSVTIGQNAGSKSNSPKETIAIGADVLVEHDYDVVIWTENDQGCIKLRDVDIRELVNRVKTLEDLVRQ